MYNDERANAVNRQRDLVLAINEFCFLQNKTNGSIKSHVGPLTMTISQQEALVTFNTRSKKFEETADFERAKQLFVSAPEGWYVILKNPTSDNKYPEAGQANTSPNTIKIGTKVNIPGPANFALYPGQMAKTVRGHKLRSNQYLLARVYDAAAAMEGMNSATIVDAEGKEVAEKTEKYFVGQLLVIKGTEVSFYIPPTGIEVIAVGENSSEYVRDAVTLEKLEYCILKDEDGNKRYLHGPAVVFPKPTETFVKTTKGGVVFKAIELSPISGIYVKVISEYEEDGVKHPVGEELFITGNEKMIYYPRPEHAVISYDGKHMHHAIAIPEGEGRYVMDRISGQIETVTGPKMYLPDPRTKVIVKRKLTDKQCRLWFPGNTEVLNYNRDLNERAVEKSVAREFSFSNSVVASAFSDAAAMDCLESKAGISRGTSYTKPRTITLDNKYDGVVSIDVWTGYAINVVSKSGEREVVIGPTTRLLDYDETMEVLELSTGKPKTTDELISTVFLRVKNNMVSDVIELQTKDFVDVRIKVSYCVNFLEEHKDKWFSVENYVKFLCDRQRSLLKREAKKYTIEEFYLNAADIVRKIALNIDDKPKSKEKELRPQGRFFKENGMFVSDVDVLSIEVERSIANILNEHQEQTIVKSLELSDAAKNADVITKLAEYERKEIALKQETELYKIKLKNATETARFEAEAALNLKEREEAEAREQAAADLQKIIDQIKDAELEREKKEDAVRIEYQKQLAAIEKDKQTTYAETVAKIMESVSDELVAALESRANADMLETVSKAVSPYAIAKNESVSETVNRLLRGTSLEDTINNIVKNK